MAVYTQTTRKYYAISEQGYRIGETHHQSKYPDYLIDCIRDLRETYQLGYGTLQRILIHHNIPRGTIAKYCRYERRNETPHKWKTILETRQTSI